jgi:hypothetical protein
MKDKMMILFCRLSPALPLAIVLIISLIIISPLMVTVAASVIFLPLALCLIVVHFFFFSFIALPILPPWESPLYHLHPQNHCLIHATTSLWS